MDCRDVRQSIDACWDRELPPDQAVRLRIHLGQCPACQAEFGPLDEWLGRPEPVIVPAGLRDRVLGAVLDAVAAQARSADDGVTVSASAAPAGYVANSSTPASRLRPAARTRAMIPLAWAGALAACIALVMVSRPAPVKVPAPPAGADVTPDALVIRGLVSVVLQPNPFAATGAAMAQAAALHQVTQSAPPSPMLLHSERRPLREDWVPLDADQNLRQLPAVISAVSTLGAS